MELTEFATALIQEGKILTLTCSKCTFQSQFTGRSRDEAVDKATDKGWVRRNKLTICPKCPACRI